MKKLLSRLLFLHVIIGCALTSGAKAQVKQTPEVIEAYRICRSFQQLLGENLDFTAAYEATFTKNPARRRAIAIADGEFGNTDFDRISEKLLVDAYKQRMQIFYLMLILAGTDKADETRQVRPEIEKIVKRETPRNARDFPAFVSQLRRDAAFLRSHIERESALSPAFAKSVRQFKSEVFSEKFEPPRDYKVAPSRGYYRDRVLSANEEFYEINGYTLTKERGRMRIVGIKFFTRLF